MDKHHSVDLFTDLEKQMNKKQTDPDRENMEESGRQEAKEPGRQEAKEPGRQEAKESGRQETKESGRQETKEPGRQETEKSEKQNAEKTGHKQKEETGINDKDKAGKKLTKAPYIATILIIVVFAAVVILVQSYISIVGIVMDMQNSLDRISGRYYGNEEDWAQYEKDVNREYYRLVTAVSKKLNQRPAEKKALLNKYMGTNLFQNLMIFNTKGDLQISVKQTELDFHEESSEELNQLLQLESYEIKDYVPEGKDGTTQCMPRYYSRLLQDGNVLVAEVQSQILDQISVHRTSWEAQLALASTRMDGDVLVLDKDSWNVIYGSELYEDISDSVQLKYESLWDAQGLGFLETDTNNYFTVLYDVNEDLRLAAVVPEKKLENYVIQSVMIIMIIFISIVVIMLVYSIHASNEQRRGKAGWKKLHKGFIYNKEIGKRLVICAVVGTIVIGLSTYYVQTLISVTSNSRSTEDSLNDTLATLEDSDQDVEDAQKFVNSARRGFCSIFLDGVDDVDFILKEDNTMLVADLDVNSFAVYDMNGESVFSSIFYLDYDKATIRKKIHDVSLAMWTDDYYLEKKTEDNKDSDLQEVAKIVEDKNGKDYLVLINMFICELPDHLQNNTMEETLGKVIVNNSGYAFAVDKEKGKFSYFPEENMIGQKVKNYGLSLNALKDGYTGDMTIDDKDMIVSVTEEGDNMLGVAINRKQALMGRMPSTLLSAGASLLCLLVLLLMLAFQKGGVEGVAVPGFLKRLGKGKSAEAMLVQIIKVFLMFLSISIALGAVFGSYIFPENSLFYYALEGSWTKGINIFSLTACIINVAEGVLIILFIRKLLGLLEELFSTRGATICRLCSSLCKYFGVIIIIYKCVADCGVNTGTLLTSAGILTTVVGLGANSLLADIYAGLFIIFEGDLQVKDVVEIDGYVGSIAEIGIRTTKIRNVDGSTKIVNNKEITKVIDRKRRYNYCHVYVIVNHKESIERIEAILARELPKFPEKFPFLYGVPEYRGISSLTDGGMTLDLRFKASPRFILEVRYEMNREIQKLFTAYDIELNIPYVLNHLDKAVLPASDTDVQKAHEYLQERWHDRMR